MGGGPPFFTSGMLNTPMETGNDFFLGSESFLGFLTSLCVEGDWPGCKNILVVEWILLRKGKEMQTHSSELNQIYLPQPLFHPQSDRCRGQERKKPPREAFPKARLSRAGGDWTWSKGKKCAASNSVIAGKDRMMGSQPLSISA